MEIRYVMNANFSFTFAGSLHGLDTAHLLSGGFAPGQFRIRVFRRTLRGQTIQRVTGRRMLE